MEEKSNTPKTEPELVLIDDCDVQYDFHKLFQFIRSIK